MSCEPPSSTCQRYNGSIKTRFLKGSLGRSSRILNLVALEPTISRHMLLTGADVLAVLLAGWACGGTATGMLNGILNACGPWQPALGVVLCAFLCRLRQQDPRDAFLRGMGVVYCCAFLSLYLQYDGLFGTDGLMPASAFLKRARASTGVNVTNVDLYKQVMPTVAWFRTTYTSLDVDTFHEALCLGGAVLAALPALGTAAVAPVFALLWLAYLSCYAVGQTFLSFQWDILLLEVGFLAIFYAPLLPVALEKYTLQRRPGANRALVWSLRFVLFKIMLMSGVVKITADCPTWLGLTALDYHYATQCLPTPLAWFAHQLPPLLQKISVATTFIIEGPATLFIISPWRSLRVCAFTAQLLLQLLIAMTGNYNFFNLLTVLLCLPLLDDGEAEESAAKSNVQPEIPLNSLAALDAYGPLPWLGRVVTSIETVLVGRVVVGLAGFGFLALSCSRMFAVSLVPADSLFDRVQIRFLLSATGLNGALEALVLPAAGFTVMVAFCLALQQAGGACVDCVRTAGVSRKLLAVVLAASAFANGIVAVTRIALDTVPLTQIDSSLRPRLPSVVFDVFQATQHFHISAGYGLFRSMTGVGQSQAQFQGQAVSAVARPEIVIEGTYDTSGAESSWLPIEFVHKPGDVSRTPTFVAPHQPRLDWQMWFAALGSYQHAPWIVHLVDKILEGSPAVIALLDHGSYPFKASPPKLVRARLFSYDFTRVRTPWAQRIPGVSFNTSNVWHRSFLREYLPSIRKGQEDVAGFLGNQGWRRVHRPKKPKRCRRAKSLGTWAAAVDYATCRTVVTLRHNRPADLFFVLLMQLLVAGLFFAWPRNREHAWLSGHRLGDGSTSTNATVAKVKTKTPVKTAMHDMHSKFKTE